MAKKVLITGARAAVAIDLARDFRDEGYNVHMADCSSAYISRWSKAPHRVHTYAAPTKEPACFFSDIRRIAHDIAPDIIIPTCEEVFYLPHAFEGTDMQDRIFAPAMPVLHQLHDKYAFSTLCREMGFTTPETHKLEQAEDIAPFKKVSEEWVFKPCYSRFGAKTMIAPAHSALSTLSLDRKTPWIAQKLIRGTELSFYAIVKAGELSAISVYTSSWRIGGGASYVFEPVTGDIFYAAKDIATRLAKKLGLTGQFACDLIKDDAGSLWPIECNPRSTSGLHLLRGNLAKAITAHVPSLATAPSTTKYMLPMMLSYGLVNALRSRRLGPWLRTLWTGKDVIGGQHDRMPVCGALVDTGLFMLHGIRSGLSLAQATTADIEWNGEPLQ